MEQIHRSMAYVCTMICTLLSSVTASHTLFLSIEYEDGQLGSLCEKRYTSPPACRRRVALSNEVTPARQWRLAAEWRSTQLEYWCRPTNGTDITEGRMKHTSILFIVVRSSARASPERVQSQLPRLLHLSKRTAASQQSEHGTDDGTHSTTPSPQHLANQRR